MKVLAIGDTHCNTSAICNTALPQANKNDCKLIIQCGDFGYLEHVRHGEQFLHKVSKHLVRNDLTMYFIDGNHDNHNLLWKRYCDGPGLAEVRQNLFYIPRGTVFKLGDVTCMGLGGAFSIDKESRLYSEGLRGVTEYAWFPNEMVRAEDMYFAKENAREHGPVRIMFTHDCPEGSRVPGIDDHVVNKWKYPQTWENRMRLREVFDVVQPQLLVHGHYHVRYTDKLPLQPKEPDDESGLLAWNYCRVDGLSNDARPGFAVVLDLDSLFVSD